MNGRWDRDSFALLSIINTCIAMYLSFTLMHFTNLSSVWIITHWGRDKMAAISQTTFSNASFLNENTSISINISLKFVSEGRIDNIPSLVQIMAWRRLGDKPLSEPMIVSLLTHICVTRPQWVKVSRKVSSSEHERIILHSKLRSYIYQ